MQAKLKSVVSKIPASCQNQTQAVSTGLPLFLFGREDDADLE